eukprot:1176114-Prorocentrum_minimum.AAC.1
MRNVCLANVQRVDTMWRGAGVQEFLRAGGVAYPPPGAAAGPSERTHRAGQTLRRDGRGVSLARRRAGRERPARVAAP